MRRRAISFARLALRLRAACTTMMATLRLVILFALALCLARARPISSRRKRRASIKGSRRMTPATMRGPIAFGRTCAARMIWRAMRNAAQLLRQGKGVEKDAKKAFKLYTRGGGERPRHRDGECRRTCIWPAKARRRIRKRPLLGMRARRRRAFDRADEACRDLRDRALASSAIRRARARCSNARRATAMRPRRRN